MSWWARNTPPPTHTHPNYVTSFSHVRVFNIMVICSIQGVREKLCKKKVLSFDVNKRVNVITTWNNISMSQMKFWLLSAFISTNLDVAIQRYDHFSTRSQNTYCATFRYWVERIHSFITQFCNCSCHNLCFSSFISFFNQTYKIIS